MIVDNKIVQLHLAIRQVQMDDLASILPFRANVAAEKASIPVRCVDPPSIVQFPAVIVLMIHYF